jgi:UDP-N-acetylglucosamine acyltransferase
MAIHPTAIVDAAAELGNVDIGPYAIIGAGVVLHDGVKVGAHAVIEGPTIVGSGTNVGHHVVLGGQPQDQKHDPSAPTRLEIGAGNVFREFSSAHRGSTGGRGLTRIGDHNYFMANSHVAHDCTVGNGTMFANSAAIAGHVEVHDGAVLGGLCAVHQFTRVGRFAMLGGGAMCAQDVPPFTIAQGDRARLYGVNILGLRRGGIDATVVSRIKEAWRQLFVSDLPRKLALTQVEALHGDVPEVAELIAFVRESPRGVCRAAVQG